ncbi:MAG: DUF389 domain-containing protein [Gemmatimonadota bacterium]
MTDPPSRRSRTVGARLSRSVGDLFGLDADTDLEGSVQRIKENVDFRGGNLWALVLAILVASVGLNVNSTAVIIGAMLISPLMGPIVGAGLGVGINDLELLKRSLRNLAIAAVVSVVASALYFAVSPLSEAQSELLARTRPTLYDVLIAFFGGAAGIVAGTRRNSAGTVVPGVAIATALMPPLCTAGFGLASRNWGFFFGALYLFLINSVFICLATVLIVRLLRFPRVHARDPVQERRVRWAMAVVAVVTIVPSGYVAWQVVRETIYQSAARRFIADNLSYPDRSIIATKIRYARDSSTIDVALVGKPLSPDVRSDLNRRLSRYGLQRTRLIVREPMASGSTSAELSRAVREGILEDLYRKNQEAIQTRDERIRMLEDEVVRLHAANVPIGSLAREVLALHPGLLRIGAGQSIAITKGAPADTTLTILTEWTREPGRREIDRLRAFLEERLKAKKIVLVTRRVR